MIFGEGLMEYFYYKRQAERERIRMEEHERRNPYLKLLRKKGKLIHLDVSEDEIARRMVRTSGDAICEVCNKTHREHPYIDDTLFQDYPYLHYICNGIIAKL